jgi:TonB family protein
MEPLATSPWKQRKLRYTTIVMLFALYAAHGRAQNPQQIVLPLATAKEQREILNVLDSRFAVLDQAVATPKFRDSFGSNVNPGRDFRGRTPIDDYRDFVLAPATRADIGEQRRRAVSDLDSGNLKVSEQELFEFGLKIKAQTALWLGITEYWTSVGPPPIWSPFREVLRSNGIEPHDIDRFDALSKIFRQQISLGKFAEAMNRTWPKLVALQVEAAKSDSAALDQLDPHKIKRLYASNLRGRCPHVMVRIPEDASVGLDPTQPQPSLVYPAEARGQRETGTVYVGSIISKEGCAQLASVFGSSGYELLDRAAVDHVMKLHFRPTKIQGVTEEGTVVVPIKFEMVETRRGAPIVAPTPDQDL